MDLPALKREFAFFKEVPAQCLQQALKDVEKAFQNFFDGRAGFPKPARKCDRRSCRFPDPKQFEVGADYVDLPKFGKLRIAKHRPIEGRILSATLSQDGGFFWVCVISG